MDLMKKKRQDRIRRHKRLRRRVRGTPECPRLCVFRSNKNIYSQIVDDETGRTIASASTLSPELRESVSYGGNAGAAAQVGDLIARKAAEKEIGNVVFDRGGLPYHGRIKALAEAARKAGLKF